MYGKQILLILCAVLFAVSVSKSATADQTGMAGIHEWVKERGRTCFKNHFHSGSSGVKKTKKAAMRAAIQDWWEYTAGEYGSDWARFRRAASRGKRCTRESGGWSCYVEARPCL